MEPLLDLARTRKLRIDGNIKSFETFLNGFADFRFLPIPFFLFSSLQKFNIENFLLRSCYVAVIELYFVKNLHN